MNVTESLRAAVAAVRADPAGVAALDAADAAAVKAKAADAKRRADLEAKVAEALPARIEAIIADYHAIEEEALRRAATELADAQIRVQYGHADQVAVAQSGIPTRISRTRLDAIRLALADRTAIPWDKSKRSAAALQSETARDARRDLDAREAAKAERALTPAEVAERVEQRRAKLEANRVGQIAARKAELRRQGILPAKDS